MALDFLENKQVGKNIYHDMVNAIIGKGLSIPHEWYFLNVLTKEEILRNRELAQEFVMFVLQYYPKYHWRCFNIDDYLSAAVCECEIHAYQFEKKYQFGFKEDKNSILSESIVMGDIATDFLIRYCNYSLIKCSGQKIILTAQSDCHKRFEDLLLKGYSLQRRAKVGYIKKPKELEFYYPEVKGFFYRLPVLPTRDLGYPIDEIIETDEGKFEEVVNN